MLIFAFFIQTLTFLSQAWWFFELFSHYAPYYALIALFFTGFHLFKKHWNQALLWVTFFAINITPLAPYLSANASVTETPTLTVFAQNAYYLNTDTSEFYSNVAELKPDLFIVHEANAIWGSTQSEVLRNYPSTYLTQKTGVHGIFMGSKNPGTFNEIPLGDQVGLEFLPENGAYKILAVHPEAPLSPSWATARNQQFADLTTYVQNSSVPVLVIGDFNCTPWSPYFENLLTETKLQDARLLDSKPGLDITWKAKSWLFHLPIDHALVSPQWEVLSFTTTETELSDHKGIVVELSLD